MRPKNETLVLEGPAAELRCDERLGRASLGM
jgi:hypothetical protein